MAKPLTRLERDPLKEGAISVFVLHYSGEVVKVEKNLNGILNCVLFKF